MLNFSFQAPNERARLYFLLAWFHAIVQERLTYAPLGWSKKYEFNESDLRCACDTIDVWIDAVAMGRTNLPPEKVPWDALRTLMSQCIYGGKIDNDFDQVYICGLTIYYGVFRQFIDSNKKISKNLKGDMDLYWLLAIPRTRITCSFHFQRLLTAFLNKLFTMKSFEGDFPLVCSVDGVKGRNITMPDGIR